MSDAGYSMLRAGAWGWPTEMLWGGRWEGGSCLGTHVRTKDFKIKKIKSKKIPYIRDFTHTKKRQRHQFANKGPSSQSYGFCSSHVWMWELDYKESWELKNWCFWAVVLEKTLDGPLDCKIKPVNPKGNQPWIFIRRTDAEAEVPVLWPPDAKSQLIRKDPDARKDWRQEKKGMTDDEIIGWHHWLNGHEFEQAPGDGEK